MKARWTAEAAVGAVMIVLGILFLRYIPNSPVNLASDLIFFGAGVLIIKRAYDMIKKQRVEALAAQTKNNKKQKPQQQNAKKKK